MATELFDQDWQYALNTIYRINSATEVRDMQRDALECIRLSIPFSQGMFHIYKREEGQAVLLDKPMVVGEEPRYFEEFNEKYAHDAFFAKGALALRTEVTRDTDQLPDELRMQTPWYKEIYAKQGIHYALRSMLSFERELIGSIDLFRPKGDGDFSDKDVKLLTVLSPHITQKLAFMTGLVKQRPADKGNLAKKLVALYGLTPRECEVVDAIIEGMNGNEISNELCISKSTLKKHVHNAYRKIDVKNRRELYSMISSLDV